jgi:hypothetical protein
VTTLPLSLTLLQQYSFLKVLTNIYVMPTSKTHILQAKKATSDFLCSTKVAMEALTLSNPIFLPPAYSQALIYFGRERG